MRIALLTPSRDGRAHLDHSEAVAATRIEALRRGLRLTRYVGKGSSNLPRNRNLLTAQALKDGADVLFWVDCDIGFNPDDFFALAAADCAVVGALPQARTHHYGEPARIAGQGVARAADATGFHPAKAVPTAFLAIKSSVFVRLIEVGAAVKYRAADASDSVNEYLHNWFFYQMRPSETHPGEIEDDAEDYYFCRKWRESGGVIHAAPDVQLRHHEGLVCHSLRMRDLWNAQDAQQAGKEKSE